MLTKSLPFSWSSMARSTFFRRSPPAFSRIRHPITARKFGSAHKRSMSAAPPDEGLYGMGLEGLRTYDQHDVDRDGPFHHCNVYAEPLALYRSGGYHPIHLGDTMQEGRYIILHKLGWGLEETIWLARDRK